MKLTREQIEEFMSDRSVNEVCEVEEFAELCRLALTALSAEPVAVTDDDGGVWFYGTAGAKCPFKPGTKLFTAPPSLLAENARLREALEENLPYLENLIARRDHVSALLKDHPSPCNQRDFCVMHQAQKGSDAIRAALKEAK